MQHEWISIMLNERKQAKDTCCMILWLHLEMQVSVSWPKTDYYCLREEKGRGRHKALQGRLRQLPWVMKIFIIWLWWRFHGHIDMSKLMKSYTSNTCSLLDTISLNNSVSFKDQFTFPDITHFEWFCHVSVIKFLNQH